MIRIPNGYVLPLSAVMLTTALYFVEPLQQPGIEPGYWDGPPPRSIEIAMALVALVGLLFFICFGIWHMLHNGWTSTWITGAGIAAWGSIASIAVVLRLRWLFRSVGEDAPHQTRYVILLTST